MKPVNQTSLNLPNLNPPESPGGRTYAVFVVTGYAGRDGADDVMFRRAADTHVEAIKNRPDFDPSIDVIVRHEIQDLEEIDSLMEGIKIAADAEGRDTAEVALFSHSSSVDGPVGSAPTSDDPVDTYQMEEAGWSEIDFDWASDHARMFIGGCNTGTGENSFGERLSELPNLEGAEVWGQTGTAYPSIYTDVRHMDVARDVKGEEPPEDMPMYLVGSNSRNPFARFIAAKGRPMKVFVDGEVVDNRFQEGVRRYPDED